MGSSGRLNLKRLGSLKIFVVLEDGVDQAGEMVRAGSLVIFRGNARPSVYETIYDALRSRTEIIARYGLHTADGVQGEMKELADVRQRLRRTWEKLETAVGPSEPVEGSHAEASLAGVAQALKRKSNRFKSEARRKAVAGAVGSPKNQLVNRQATRTRVEAIDARLAERQNEVCSILPWMKAMETALRLEVDRSFRIVEKLAKDVGTMLSGHRFFKTGRTTPAQQRGIAARLKLVKRDVSTLLSGPFLGFGRKAMRCLDQAVSQVEAGNADRAQELLERVIVGSDRILLQRVVEDLISQVSLADIAGLKAESLRRLRQRTDFLLKLSSDAELTESYFDVAVQLRLDSDKLDACRHMLDGGLPDQARALMGEFKQSLKQISRRLAH